MNRDYEEFIQKAKEILSPCWRKAKKIVQRIFSGRYLIFLKKPRVWIWFAMVLYPFLWPYLHYGFFSLSVLLMFLVPEMLLCFLVLSRPAEALLRRLEDARRVATQTEKERLLPLFNSVYEQVKESSPMFHSSVTLYLIDTAEVNAYALGYDSIILTRGLVETLTDEEIKGTLAHEFAHILNGDSQVQQLLSFATSVWLWIVLALDWILKKIIVIFGSGFFGSIASILHSILAFAANVVINFFLLIVSAPSKLLEYRADEYASSIGYGEGLKNALYKLYDMQVTDKQRLITRLQEDHPRLAYRIERLEHLEI